MEWHTIETKQKVLKQITLIKGKTKKIVVNKYYNLDGDIIDEGTDTTKFDSEKDFEIIATTKEMQFGDGDPFEMEDWAIYVDGERFDAGYELTSYHKQKTQLVLRGCTGCG